MSMTSALPVLSGHSASACLCLVSFFKLYNLPCEPDAAHPSIQDTSPGERSVVRGDKQARVLSCSSTLRQRYQQTQHKAQHRAQQATYAGPEAQVGCVVYQHGVLCTV
jgi:hypothetical protein